MRFKLLELKNFRQYKDAKFEFKNGINILQGDNGVGKSTLMASIIFALYGKEKMLSSKLIKEKDFFLANIQNVEETLGKKIYKDSETIVKLKVELNNKDEYLVKRQYNSETLEEEVKVLKSNIKNGNEKSAAPYKELEEKLPEEIAPLLFFDGERIKAIEQVIGSKSSDAFKEEVEKILKIEELNGGKRLLNRVHGKEIKNIDDKELQEAEKSLESAESKLKEKEEEIKRLEQEKQTLGNEERELKEYFKNRRESEEKIKKIEGKEKELRLIEEMIQDKEKIIKRKLILENSLAINMLLFKNILKTIKSNREIYEISGIEQKAIDDILKKDRCICNNVLVENSREALLKVRETLPPESFQAVLSSSLKNEMLVEENENEKKTYLKEYTKKGKEKINIGNDIKVLQNGIPESDTEMKNKNRRYREVSELREKVGEQIAVEKSGYNLIKRIVQNEEQKKQQKLKELQKYEIEKISLELIEESKAILEKKINSRKEKIKEELQAYLNIHLKDLLRDGVKVEIDDRLKPGSPVFVNRTTADSTGQGVLISLAYLFALIDVARIDGIDSIDEDFEYDQEEFPVVLDGVTATLDVDHTKRVMEKLKEYEGQVIILSNSATINLIMESFDKNEKIITITRNVNDSETKVGEKYGI